jgi:L-arginine dehydrogenase
VFVEIDNAKLDMPAPERVFDALREAFRGLASGDCVQPTQTVIVLPDGQGDCIYYSAYVGSASAIGVKASPYLRARLDAGLRPVTAYTLVLDAQDGTPRILVDSVRLTTERTAATTLLAVEQLMGARAPAVISVVGTGEIGRSHARYAHVLFPHADILMFSPTAVADGNRGDERRATIAAEIPRVTVTPTLDEAVAMADVVMLCTSSGTPVVDVDRLPATCALTSVGTNVPDAHEIDWQRLPELEVYCDYRETCPNTAGDMRLAQAAGTWQADAVQADLPELLTGARQANTTGRRYFRATGLAIEDITIATLIGGS